MNTIPAASGIYIIRNTQTGFCYIGASKNMRVRVRVHQRALIAGTHSNKAMQGDWTAHGPDSFVFEIGETIADPDALQAAENKLIESHAGQTYNHKPSNMRVTSASERDMITYRTFHDWRVWFYGRMGAMDSHILATLKGDIEGTIERIDAELQRREQK
jgi:hypothetical protein